MNNCCKDTKKCCGISKVVIPAALGDETGQYKPENGAYFNTLVEYQASGVSYMYTNEGVPTRMGDGIVATIEVGETTTLQPGENATVENVGDKYHAVLDFGIPEGEKGDTGDAATVNVGTTTTGAPGADASVTNSGDEHNAVLDFVIPRGSQGEQGIPGEAATIEVGTVTTLDSDQPATVTNSGMSSAAVFDFGIPKGDKGDTGAVSSEVVSELPATGDDSKFYLVEKDPSSQTASGDYFQIDNPDNYGNATLSQLTGNAEQTTYSGKNLASLEVDGAPVTTTKYIGGVPFTIDEGVIHINGTTEANKNFYFDPFNVQSGSAVLSLGVTGYTDSSAGNAVIILQKRTGGGAWDNDAQVNFSSVTDKSVATTLDSTYDYRIRWYVNSNTFTNATIKVQLEYGSTKTSFEPYVGGTASPNPDYPQAVNTVTGEQTITISDGTNTQSHTFDLGNIELAKIGTYQDRIYKEAESNKWYIEKQVGKVVYSGATDEAWTQSTVSGQIYWYVGISDSMNYSRTDSSLMSNSFTYHGENDANGFYMNAHNLVIFNHGLSATTVDAWKTWLASNPTTVYYALATPTTTEITDETLLAQLNFIASLYGGVNNISITGTGAQGEIAVKYQTWDRYNRYDVYIWNDEIGDYQILNP